MEAQYDPLVTVERKNIPFNKKRIKIKLRQGWFIYQMIKLDGKNQD